MQLQKTKCTKKTPKNISQETQGKQKYKNSDKTYQKKKTPTKLEVQQQTKAGKKPNKNGNTANSKTLN